MDERSEYVIESGPALTQYDSEGKARVFQVGDTIPLTDAEAAIYAGRVRPVAASPAVHVAVLDDEDTSNF